MTAGRVTGVLEGANIDEAEGKRESAPEREKRERRDEREIARDRTSGREREREMATAGHHSSMLRCQWCPRGNEYR